MHRHSLTYRGAMLNINRYRLRASSCPDIYRNSMTTIAKEKTQWTQGLNEFKSVLIDMLDFSFFTDIRFTLFAFSNFLLYAWYDVPYVYLADNAVELGFTETDGSIFIAMIGAYDTYLDSHRIVLHLNQSIWKLNIKLSNVFHRNRKYGR